MKEVIEKYKKWRAENDESYCYDEIFDFVDGNLSRGELLEIMDTIAKITNY